MKGSGGQRAKGSKKEKERKNNNSNKNGNSKQRKATENGKDNERERRKERKTKDRENRSRKARKTTVTMKTTAELRRGEIQLTARDLKMLAALEKWIVLGIGQMVGLGLEPTLGEAELIARFFNKMEREDYKLGVFNRIHALEAQGYINGHSFLRQPKAYTLTERGYNALRDEPVEQRPEIRDFVSEAMIRHELKVTAVGLVLTEVLGLSAGRQHPQAVWAHAGGRRRLVIEGAADLWIDSPQSSAVEVELTQKSKRRYREVFESYRRRLPRGGAVLYLTGWPGGEEVILRNAREQRAPFVHACSLSEFSAAGGRAAFRGAVEGRSFVLAASSSAAGSGEAQ